MWNGKCSDLDISNFEAVAALEGAHSVYLLERICFVPRALRSIDLSSELAGQPFHSFDVIRVTMSDKDGIDALRLQSCILEASSKASNAKPGIHQKPALLCFNVSAVSTAATTQN